MADNKQLDFVLAQITGATQELRAYHPPQIDWVAYSKQAAKKFIPWLTSTASGLRKHVGEILNASVAVRKYFDEIKGQLPSHISREMEKSLTAEKLLLDRISGNIISEVIEKFLISEFPDGKLKSNGKSDYPDLYDTSVDYSKVPKFTRRATEYEAALKGKEKRPVRVPDGLEIKTCLNRLGVDCHHPHTGLHLILRYSKAKQIDVDDVLVGFLQRSDYRESKRQTTATTPKYSFGGGQFISLLTERVEEAESEIAPPDTD